MHILDHEAERRAAINSDISRVAFVCLTLALAIVGAAAIFVFKVSHVG